jgi:hypothetical protein
MLVNFFIRNGGRIKVLLKSKLELESSQKKFENMFKF